MRRPQPSPEHAEAVSRRLATLSAELATVRGEQPTHTRIRPEPPEGLPGPASQPAPVIIPTPGRHASRRPSGPVARGPADRPGLSWLSGVGPTHVAVVAVVAAVAVGLAAWWVVRGAAEPVALPAVTTLDTPAVEATGSPRPVGDTASSAQAVSAAVTVDVAGAVRRPGIAVLPPGSRVVDALEEAGGPKRGVDLTSLNLARVLVDGEQILVGVAAPTGVAGAVGAAGSAQPAGALVNLNSADQAALEGLPGVGPVTATSIIDWRTEHGGFSSVEELLEVDGIGDATLADLAPLVTI